MAAELTSVDYGREFLGLRYEAVRLWGREENGDLACLSQPC